MLSGKKIYLVTILLILTSPSIIGDDADQEQPIIATVTTEKLLATFEEYAQKAMADWSVPGMAIAIVEGDKIIYSHAFGVKKVGGNDPVDVNTLFQIGSISKSFTSTLAGILVDQKILDWKKQVIDYYPDCIMQDPIVTREIMIQDLFSQNSGLPAHIGDNQAVLGYSADHIVSKLRYAKPISSFRSEFAYQNIFFLIADKIMQHTTQKNWLTLVHEHIFQPVGMKNSSATIEAFDAATNVTTLHQKEKGVVIALEKDYEGKEFVYTCAPAGGINSTATDMAQYLRMLLNQGKYNETQIIESATLNYAWSPKTIMRELANRWSFYCLGWIYTEQSPAPILWHNGATLGNKNMLALIPEKNIGIIVLSNLQASELPEALALQFLDMYVGNPDQNWSDKLLALRKNSEEKALLAPEEEQAFIEKTTHELDSKPLPLSSYCGLYHNNVYDTIEIIEEDQKLFLLIGPHKTRMNLTPLFRDIFRLHWSAAGDDLTSNNDKVHFILTAAGKPAKMYIEFFKDDAEGMFDRIEESKK